MNNAPTNRPDTNKTSALAARKSRSSGPGMKGIAIHDVGSIASVASATPARMMSTPNVISTCAATRVNLYFIYLTSRRQARVLQPREQCSVAASRAPRAPDLAPQCGRSPELDANDGPRLGAPSRVQHHAQERRLMRSQGCQRRARRSVTRSDSAEGPSHGCAREQSTFGPLPWRADQPSGRECGYACRLRSSTVGWRLPTHRSGQRNDLRSGGAEGGRGRTQA